MITDILDASYKISAALSQESREPEADVSMALCYGPTTRVKVNTTGTLLLLPFNTAFLSTRSNNIIISALHLLCKRKMKNFRVRETGTTSRNKSIQLAVAAEPHTNQMQVRRSMSTTEWTDEKHSLYLKSMEASFVNQLYDSKERMGWSCGQHANISDPNLLMDALFNSTTNSGQFKVLRGGCWRKMNYERSNTETNRTNDQCEDIKSHGWIRRFRTSTKRPGLTSPAPEDFTSRQFHYHESQISQQNLFCSDTEISDQNFVDEVVEGQEENNRSNKKRMKSSMSDASDNDQIVPVSKSSRTGDGGGGGTEN